MVNIGQLAGAQKKLAPDKREVAKKLIQFEASGSGSDGGGGGAQRSCVVETVHMQQQQQHYNYDAKKALIRYRWHGHRI